MSLDIDMPGSDAALHRKLARFNRRRLSPALPHEGWREDLQQAHESTLLEGEFVERERAAFAAAHPVVPTAPEAFMEWFEALKASGPGQNHSLFPWLAGTASREQMKWFITQEVAGEAGFEDLVAMSQVKLPMQAKLEMARNYWDEMGRGHADGMHGRLLDRLVEELQLSPTIEETVWESLALANLMVALAANRRYAWHSVGALGVVEMTAPGRVSKVNEGLRRLNISAAARSYFQLHAGLDVRHSLAWNTEVILPLVTAHPELAQPLAEGAWMRLNCGARCFARYAAELQGQDWTAISELTPARAA